MIFTYLDGSLEGWSVPPVLAVAAQLRHSGYSSWLMVCTQDTLVTLVKHNRLGPVLYLTHAAALYDTMVLYTGNIYRFYRNKCTVSLDLLFRGLVIASSQKFIYLPGHVGGGQSSDT